MRLQGQIADLDYSETKRFFRNRAGKFQENNPYSVTMYQDNNPDLVKTRNKKEIEKILPLLDLNQESKILDIACGIGRWSDAITQDIARYCGVDFSEELVDIARRRNYRGGCTGSF